MEFRQVLILLSFVVSAVFAKAMLPGNHAAGAASSSPADFMLAALPADLLDAGTHVVPGVFDGAALSHSVAQGVPGSFVAIIVALLGLVAVARRQV